MFRTLLLTAVAAVAVTFGAPSPQWHSAEGAHDAPYLFVDDQNITRADNVARQGNQPRRVTDAPVVTSGPGHRNWQPWLTVVHDPTRPGPPFRMWYNASNDPEDILNITDLAYVESDDGIHWSSPYRRLDTAHPVTFGADVTDDGPGHEPPGRRYKLVYFVVGGPGRPAGGYVAFSPDGINWTHHPDNPVIPQETDDIFDAYYDAENDRYILLMKLYREHTWTNAEGDAVTETIRLVGISTSKDFIDWTEPRVLFSPSRRDPGITEWYGGTIIGRRGDLYIGLLRVSRDDLTVDESDPDKFGIGYTVLMWSRNGIHWERDDHDDKFFEPHPEPEAWDHSHAWITSAVPRGDEVLLYYGGYRGGHKANRFEDRQVGLAAIEKDRYVARVAGEGGGALTTRTVLVPPRTGLMINIDPNGGYVRVSATDPRGRPVPGFAPGQCDPVTEDGLAEAVRCRRPWSSLAAHAIRLRFDMTAGARVFGFEFTPSR